MCPTATARLGPFSPKEATTLIDRVTQHEQPQAPALERSRSKDALLHVAELCGHLPLAVALAGRRLRTRPSWSIADLARRLEADQSRLRHLAVGGRTVEAAFTLSYQSLPEPQRRAFRLLALHPGTDYTPDSAAALLNTSRTDAEDRLEALLDEHLLHSYTHGRYRHHDLLRLYARDRAHAEDTQQARSTALLRLVRWYCDTAETARRQLEPWQADQGPAPALAPAGAEPETGPAAALRWLQRERANLTAVTKEAARRGWHDCTQRLAAAAHAFLALHAYGTDSLAGLHLGLEAACQAGERHGQAQALRDLGAVYGALGRHEEAAELHQRALALSQAAGDALGVARARCALGQTHAARGHHLDSREQHRQALTVFREHHDRHGQARSLAGLALADWFTGATPQRSTAQHRRAFALFRELGDVRGLALETSRLGMAHWFFGDYRACAEQHRRALTLFEQAHDRRGQALARSGLALAQWHLGQPERSLDTYRRALAAYQDTCDQQGQAVVLQRLGYVHWATGHYDKGEAELREALALCAITESRTTQAWALTSLGYLYLRLRRDDGAAHLLGQGLSLSRELGDRHCQSSGLLGLALTALNQGDLSGSQHFARQSLDLARALGNPHGQAWGLIATGLTHLHGHTPTEAAEAAEATDCFRTAAAIAEHIHEPHTTAMARHGMGCAAALLDHLDEAEAHFRTALVLRGRIMDRHGEAETRAELGALLRRTGRPREARAEEEAASALYATMLTTAPAPRPAPASLPLSLSSGRPRRPRRTPGSR
ncbi:tetratricopeptide repeat protein [Streptomyces sp. G45]|uniref:tetratricopeptide repeat protein n=1 Tax=Streptomyces sp. G45 TaxID=3406627 RepID=UPI003C28A61A